MRILIPFPLLLITLAAGGCDLFTSEKPAQPQATTDGTKQDAELSRFAHENIPEVERMIDELAMLIIERQSRLDDLAKALRTAGQDPARDRDHQKWTQMMAQLDGVLSELRQLRGQTFVNWKKHLLKPDSDAQGMATLLDEATAAAMSKQERIASILAGELPVIATASTQVTPTKSGTSPKSSTPTTPSIPTPPSTPTTDATIVPKAAVSLAVLPLLNASEVQLTMTQAVFAGRAGNRFTVKAPFDQYAHGPRAALEHWIAPLGASVIRRSDVDAQIVAPSPDAATRGFDAAGAVAHGIDLAATHVLTGRIDAVTAAKRSENGRDVFDVQVKFRIDLLRISDRATIVSQDYVMNDTILAAQFRGFSDTTVAARIVRSMTALVQNDQALSQKMRQAW